MEKRINCDNCAGPLQRENKNCEYCGSINPLYQRQSSDPYGPYLGGGRASTAMSVATVSIFANQDREEDYDDLRSPFDLMDMSLLKNMSAPKKQLIRQRIEQLRAQQPVPIP